MGGISWTSPRLMGGKRKSRTQLTKRGKREKRTDGPNGGVRIGSLRHKRKLLAAEKRERDAAEAAETAAAYAVLCLSFA